MRLTSMVMIVTSILLIGNVAHADPLELRRPYVQSSPVSFGFDNQPGTSGCTDYECGSVCYHGHGGNDFPLSYGTDILAGADGTVRAIVNSCADYGYLGNTCGGRCGNYVQMEHSNGDRTIYCHMRRDHIYVSVGDSVSCGDVIGQSASSGSSTGPHLHLGWRPGAGANVDVYGGSCNSSPGAWVDQGSYGQPPSAECACQPTTEVCDGRDNNCDGTVDSGEVCEIDLMHQAPHSYTQPSTTDVDGDGIQNVCARFSAGFRCFRPTGEGWESVINTELMAESDGWGHPEYYSTVRMGDVTGDGRADVCARGPDGFSCWRSTGDDFEPFDSIGWSDDSGWDRPQFYTTIRLADLNGNGKDDVCARGVAGWRCYLSTGEGFGERIDTELWTNDDDFHRARYYGTIRTGDITGDGQEEVCAREADGFACYRFTGDGFERVADTGMRDDQGWDHINYWPSIRLADIDGDGRHAVCARDSSRLFCFRFEGDDFGSRFDVANLSDDSGWSDPTNYSTLRVGDVTGDGSDDLCIRANRGMLCYRVDGDDVTRWDGPEWSNANGWEDLGAHGPIFITNIDHEERGALCGRSADGLTCEVYGGDEDFVAYPLFEQFTDSGSWHNRRYYSTLRMGQGHCRADWCDPEPEPEPPTDDAGIAGGDDVGVGGDWDTGGSGGTSPGGDEEADGYSATMSTSSCSSTSGGSGSFWIVLAALLGLSLHRRRRRQTATLGVALLAITSLAFVGCDDAPEVDEEAMSTAVEAEATQPARTGGGISIPAEFEEYDVLAIHGPWAIVGEPIDVPRGTDGPLRYEPVLLNEGERIEWPLDQPMISEARIVGDEPTLFSLGLDHVLVGLSLDDLDDAQPFVVDDHLISQVSPAADGCCITYVEHGDEGQNLHVYHLDSGESVSTRLGFSIGWAPVVAEGGERVAWTASPHGQAAILVDRPGGDEARIIVNEGTDLRWEELDPFPAGIHAPVWTPDGIAFESEDTTLWLIDTDGTFTHSADGTHGMFWDETRQKLLDHHGEPIRWRAVD